MLNKFVFNKFYTNPISHLGGTVNMYSLNIPEHDEFYLIREFKQKFKILGLNFHIATDTNTFTLPPEFEELMRYWNDSTTDEKIVRFCDNVLDDMITHGAERFKLAYKSMLDQLKGITDLDRQDILVRRLNDMKKRIEVMYSKWSVKERQANASFINSGYIPMYKMERGASSSFYLGRYLDDRLVLIRTEFMTIKAGMFLQTVQQISLTDDMVKAYFEKEAKKKGGK